LISALVAAQQAKVKDANGCEISLDKAYRQARGGLEPHKSTERNQRAAGVAKVTPRKKTTAPETGAVVIAGCDALLAFFGSKKDGVSAAIVVAEFFNRPDGTSGLAEMSVASLLDPKSSAQLNVLKPEIVANSGKIRFGVGSSIGKMTLSGAMLRVINRDLTDRFFELEHEALRMAIDLGWAAICSADTSQHLKTTSIAALPYVDTSGSALYVCMGTEGAAPVTRNEIRAKCPLKDCAQDLPVLLMRQHQAYHLLHEREKTVAIFPCGFCGGESAHKSPDMTQLVGCAIWLEKNQQRMYCQLVGGDVRYTMGPASKCTKTSPSTNTPRLCPSCPQKPVGTVHWKYNMGAHFSRSHSIALYTSL
jgi:hypothetical protein